MKEDTKTTKIKLQKKKTASRYGLNLLLTFHSPVKGIPNRGEEFSLLTRAGLRSITIFIMVRKPYSMV